jgi:flavin-dependent dehydrogenase
MDIAGCLVVPEVQVLVIGGGPAGAAAAISARQYGLSVTVLEQQAFPRHRPGESLHPGIEPLLLQLGLTRQWLNGFTRYSGCWQEVRGQRYFQSFGSDASGAWQGFHIPRTLLDKKLLEVAERVGVTVVQPCNANSIKRTGKSYCIGTVKHGDFNASIVIDASGSSNWLSRHLSHAVISYSQPLFARYGYVRQALKTGELPAPCFTADFNRWLWIAAINAECMHWTQLNFNGSPASLSLIDNPYNCKANRFQQSYRPDRKQPLKLRHAKSIGPIRGADVTWRKANQCSGKSFFKVGDAGFVLDPASSHGVLKALMSGIYAAYISSQLLAGCLTDGQAQACYQDWMDDLFTSDMQALSDFYKGLAV